MDIYLSRLLQMLLLMVVDFQFSTAIFSYVFSFDTNLLLLEPEYYWNEEMVD